MAYPRWRHILGESQRHALKAVDEWNSLTGNYGDFIGHMYRAWHYVLHSEFHRAKTDYHYRDPKTGRHVEIDGEPKAWDLDHCLKQRFPGENNPVRRNVELFGKLRNKVEHRCEHGLKIVTGGKAQALVINYEAQVVRQFGKALSMADRLRFPVFLESITSADELRTVAAKLPKRTRDLVARFESGLDQGVLDDLRYDYRIRLVPIVGPKTDADFAGQFRQARRPDGGRAQRHGWGRPHGSRDHPGQARRGGRQRPDAAEAGRSSGRGSGAVPLLGGQQRGNVEAAEGAAAGGQ
jgi:hypothetical protein